MEQGGCAQRLTGLHEDQPGNSTLIITASLNAHERVGCSP
jgi:hypothetical protein